MKHFVPLLLALAASPALADVDAVIDDHILPGYAAFAAATASLDAAVGDCAPEAVRPAWNAAFDAWMGVSHLGFGPVEEDGRSVVIAFWPDDRGATPRALAALVQDEDPIIDTAEGTAQISVAARGLFALEYLLYDPQFSATSPYRCALIQALASDLAQVAAQVDAAWRDEFADTLRTAGDPDNLTFLSEREATQAVFTSLLTGLEFTADTRLGRPLGTFDKPRPTRAEAWRSGRSQRNVVLSLMALADLTRHLAEDQAPVTLAALDRAIALAQELDDPAFAGVSDPSRRLKVEIVQQAIHAASDAALAEIGPSLGVSKGFNSSDGD